MAGWNSISGANLGTGSAPAPHRAQDFLTAIVEYVKDPTGSQLQYIEGKLIPVQITSQQAKLIFELYRERGHGFQEFTAAPADAETLAALEAKGLASPTVDGKMRLTRRALVSFDGWVRGKLENDDE